MTRQRRYVRKPSQEEVEIQTDWDLLRGRQQTHHCETCEQDTPITPEYTCMRCGSEDVFDKSLPEWPCERCGDHTAVYKSTCKECQEALAKTIEDEPYYNPKEDYGSPAHRAFNGRFPEGIRKFGDPR